MTLKTVPIKYADAMAFVEKHHRHLKPPPGAKFWVAVSDELGCIRGVAIVGRPTARLSDDGLTVEVTRCATDGAPNACSMLYRACWRAASALGFRRLITFTLPEESGSSLRGAGFKCLGYSGGGKWDREGRPRRDEHPLQQKFKWELVA